MPPPTTEAAKKVQAAIKELQDAVKDRSIFHAGSGEVTHREGYYSPYLCQSASDLIHILDADMLKFIDGLPEANELKPEACKEILTLLADCLQYVDKEKHFRRVEGRHFDYPFPKSYDEEVCYKGIIWQPWSERGEKSLVKYNKAFQDKILDYFQKIDSRLSDEIVGVFGRGKSTTWTFSSGDFNHKIVDKALKRSSTALEQLMDYKRPSIFSLSNGSTNTRTEYDKRLAEQTFNNNGKYSKFTLTLTGEPS